MSDDEKINLYAKKFAKRMRIEALKWGAFMFFGVCALEVIKRACL